MIVGSGNDVGRSLRHALFLSAAVRRPSAACKSSWAANLDGMHRSAQFVDEANLSQLPPYWRVGAHAAVEWGRFSVIVYIDNLFDNRSLETAQHTVDPGRSEGFAPARGILA